MLRKLVLAGACAASIAIPAAAPAANMAHIDAYVTPYYNSAGPRIDIGPFSAGLASNDNKRFVATVQQMKQHWLQRSFIELYVGAIQLYDNGYRNEATYWFYSAQYAGRQLNAFADQAKLGSIGDPGFELLHAQEAFFELSGPYINSFAFSQTATTKAILARVRSERATVPDVRKIYPGVAFVDPKKWASLNAQIAAGLKQLEQQVPHRDSSLKTRPFPGGY
jgi:hypothetical protein